MKAAGVCRMREAFLEECRRHDYMVPSSASLTPPVLQGLEDLREEDVIDKSAVATRTSAIQQTLVETDQQIGQLCQQLKGQLFAKGFLIRVSAVLNDESADVTEAHIAGLIRQVEEINNALLSVTSSDNFQFCSTSSQVIKPSHIERASSALAPGKCDANITKSGVDSSLTGRNKFKPVAAVRSTLSKSNSSRYVNNTSSLTVDSIRGRPRSEVSPSRSTPDSTKAKERTVGSFHGPVSNPSHSLDSNSCPPDNSFGRSDPNLAQTCETPGHDPMSDGSEDDEESPYDNVITLQEYLNNSSEMFRRKRSNASKTDLDRSNTTLSSKDNFLAVTSKHVAPSNIPRSQDSTTQSPHLGRSFQMLKMTPGFDFVLDDSTSTNDSQQQSNGSDEARNANSDNDVIVDSQAPLGGVGVATPGDLNIADAKNRLSSSSNPIQDFEIDNISSHARSVDQQSNRKEDRGGEALTNLAAESRAFDTNARTGPENGTEKRDSLRLTPSAPPACEVLTPTSHSQSTRAHSDTPHTITAGTTAGTNSSVVERTPAGEEEKPLTGSGLDLDLPVSGSSGSSSSSPSLTKDMEFTRRHPSVPLRSPPTSRGSVNSAPPPVAKKPVNSVSFRSGKPAPPVPGVKPALKPSQSAHVQLSSYTVDHLAPSICDKIEESRSENRVVSSSDSRSSSPLTSPYVSKSPNPVGTAPKPGARGSVNGIAELFGGRNIPHKPRPGSTASENSNNDNETNKTDTSRTSRDYTPSPPVPARKRASGTLNSTAGEHTHIEKTTSCQVEQEKDVCSKLKDRDSAKSVKEKDSEGEGVETSFSAIQAVFRHSTLAADAVAWPKSLQHPELKSPSSGDKERRDSKTEPLVEAGGIKELVGKTHSSIIPIHSRLHRGSTVETAAIKSKSETEEPSHQTTTTKTKTVNDLDTGVKDSTAGRSEFWDSVEESSTSFRMHNQDSVDTLINASEGEGEGEEHDRHHHQQHHKASLDRSVSFTSDQDVRDAILSLDAIIKSEPLDDCLDLIPSLRLSTTSTASSIGSNPRPLSTPTSPVSFRRQHELGVSSADASTASNRRKSSFASGYENWTINRAVTRLITSATDFDLGSEEDEDDEDNEQEEEVDDGVSEGVSSPFPMKRDVAVKGSKDSGLCDDISLTSDHGGGHVMTSTPNICVTSGVTDGGPAAGGVELMAADGKIPEIPDLKALRLLTQYADDDEVTLGESGRVLDTQHEKHGEQDMDSISVASDILFIPGSRGGSRIRKYAAEQQGKVVEEDDEEQTETADVDFTDGSGNSKTTANQRQDPHSKMAAEKGDNSRLSGSSSPEWQEQRRSEGTRPRLSHEMSDSISMASSGDDEEHHSITMDSSYDETDSAREGMLKMRQLLVKGVLDSEKVYLDILTVLINYKKLLETNSACTQPVISREDVNVIFSNIETIYKIHSEFVTSLEPKVKDWHHEESIGEIFKIMISKFIDFGNYLTNYKQAVSTIHRCAQENEQFQELAQKIVVTSTVKESSSLEDALFKPVQRVQRNTLVLHDLIKYTPQDHPDHEALQKALKLSHHILETFATAVPSSATTQENRRLVKSSFLVELVNGARKLRYMFLFSDLLICTKRETHRNNKVTFEPKWFTPLSQANFDTKFDYTDDTKHTKTDDIDQLKSKLRALKKEMREEMKKFDDKDKHRSLVSLGGATRVVEKLRKKISQYEAQLILASPRLPFKISLKGGKVYTLLMTTDYEREEWKETIRSLSSRNSQQTPVMSSIFVQDLINSVKETPQVNKIGSVLLQKDEDILTGTLNVTIHKMNGLTQDCDTYCCLEMDSFGHFFMKARTHICEGSRDPAWNEDFELELESSQTLRFLCFRRGESGGDVGDTMLGRGALELSKQWLKGSFQEKTVSMNEISLVVSVRHTPAEKTMQRTPSRVSAAVFGVKITSLARREGKTVPTIVTACLQEVEKRGLDELGIYRVSGVTSELQRIKKLFDKNIRSGAAALTDVDINAVTGILKLYFRELPEPLFTEACYQNFTDTLKLKDEEAKAECMLSLLHGLPDTNYYTIVTLLEHLIKVARNVGENKMSIHNLSTIFGPTLLAPATNQTASDPLEMMCKGAEQVLRQSGVVNYLLGLAVSGRSLRRSA